MPQLINSNTVNGVSAPFTLTAQITVFALGLGPQDYVEFEQILMSSPPVTGNNCECPPLVVSQLTVLDTTPLTCCGVPIQLTATRSYVILDAPQGVPLRARVVSPTSPLTTQRVWYETTNTAHPAEGQRGCCPPWYVNASTPLGNDSMIYGPDPDLRDPRATVVLTACDELTVVGYLYPAPQVGANIPVYACGCNGALLGYAVNATTNPAYH